jgi:hypothetical protein
MYCEHVLSQNGNYFMKKQQNQPRQIRCYEMRTYGQNELSNNRIKIHKSTLAAQRKSTNASDWLSSASVGRRVSMTTATSAMQSNRDATSACAKQIHESTQRERASAACTLPQAKLLSSMQAA